MPIVVRCACGKEYHFKDEYAGRRAKCPACGQVVRIPGTRPAGSPSPHSPLREDRRSRTTELALLGSVGFVVLVGIGLVVYFLFFSGPAPRTPKPAAPSPRQPSALAGTRPAPAPQTPNTPANREVIGRWFDEDGLSTLGGCRITIFREQGNLYVEFNYKDGRFNPKDGRLDKEMVVESPSSLGRRFDSVATSPSGDYWVIDSRGNLQTRDNDGLFSTAQPIE